MLIQKKAYAKINLFLKILGRRQDGYHNIFTIMQKISLADDVKINIVPGEKKISVSCPGINIKSEENTAYTAAKLFLECANISAVIDIEIDKKIPARAGLGGGSSDAASVLLALNECYNFVLPEGELMDIAAKVGADVPFFLKEGSCALCEGIGEIVTPLEADLSGYCLIAKPIYDISTRQAYADWDKYKNSASPMPVWPFDIFKNIHNDFAELVFSQNTNIREIHKQLIAFGAMAAELCGSGSALFGLFEESATAHKCKNALKQRADIEFCGVFKLL